MMFGRGGRTIAALAIAAVSLPIAIAAVPPNQKIRASRPNEAAQPAITRIDHVPIAVNDLEVAEDHFRALGFTIKPGRPHDNGIRNGHAKFRDGNYFELITAPAARDDLTTAYRKMMAEGDGPAFLALYAPDRGRLAFAMKTLGDRVATDNGTIDFRDGDPFGFLFFGNGAASPTDWPEHYVHRNGARGITAVWIAVGDRALSTRTFGAFGLSIAPGRGCVPLCGSVDRVAMAAGRILLLPRSRRLLPNRPIVGATVAVDRLDVTRAALRSGGIPMSRVIARGRSLFVPPDLANGLWLEFREAPRS